MPYNPQLRVQFTEILDDGSETEFDLDLFGGLSDLRNSGTNKPLHVTASVQKALGGAQDAATLLIHNSPYIETFRQNPQAELERFRGKKLRMRIWAWWDDNEATDPGPEPQTVVVFVGDVLDGFDIISTGITDSAIQVQGLSHSWLVSSGKYQNVWLPETDYFTICIETLEEIVTTRNQGREELGFEQFYIVDDSLERLKDKVLESPYAVNSNPLEVLNKICKEFDYTFGINGNIPYILPKSKPFAAGLLPVDPSNSITAQSIDVSFETGMSSLINYGMYEFSFSHAFTHDFIVGRVVTAFDEPQVNVSSTFVAGRISELSIQLDNMEGHSVETHCQYLYNFNPLSPTEADVTLPEKRADNSGLRNT